MSSWKPPKKAIDIGLAAWAVLLIVGVAAAMILDKGQVDNTPAATFPIEASPTTKVVNHKWSFDDAKKALAKDEPTVLVLGDSTGNDSSEWVDLWTQAIGEKRAVSRSTWSDATQKYDAPTMLGGGNGRQVTVWNGSQPGSTPAYHADSWPKVGKKADLVILNFGHNGTEEAEIAGLDALLKAVLKRSPKAVVVGTAQNPQEGDAGKGNREAVARWNKANGIPTIDVNAAFARDGRGDALRADSIHPNAEGSRVWADAVVQAVGVGS